MNLFHYIKGLIILTVIGAVTHAAQYIMYNSTYKWDGVWNPLCHFTDDIPLNLRYPQAQNWLTPINYRDGQLYARFQVTGKPSNRTLCIGLSYYEFFSLENYNEEWAKCPEGRQGWYSGVDFSTDGIYYGRFQGWSHLWGSNTQWFCTGSCQYVCWDVWDVATTKVLQTEGCDVLCFQGNINDHCPFKIKIQAIHVSQGSQLAIPYELAQDWADCPTSWPHTVDIVEPAIPCRTPSAPGTRETVMYDLMGNEMVSIKRPGVYLLRQKQNREIVKTVFIK